MARLNCFPLPELLPCSSLRSGHAAIGSGSCAGWLYTIFFWGTCSKKQREHTELRMMPQTHPTSIPHKPFKRGKQAQPFTENAHYAFRRLQRSGSASKPSGRGQMRCHHPLPANASTLLANSEQKLLGETLLPVICSTRHHQSRCRPAADLH